MKHLISIDDIRPDDYAELFKVADKLVHPTAMSKKGMEDKITLDEKT